MKHCVIHIQNTRGTRPFFYAVPYVRSLRILYVRTLHTEAEAANCERVCMNLMLLCIHIDSIASVHAKSYSVRYYV